MTTNILLDETGREPIRSEDEYFILKRNDISYRILLESKTQYTGEGYLILTSNRLVIFPTKQNCHFKAIEIPLKQIYQEEFKQPLFGKNYLTAKCNPIFASSFGAFTFTIWLKGNRMGTLIGAFYTLIDSLRNNQGKKHDINVINALKDNNFNELFAIDPEDNSFIYQVQPPPANIPKQNYKSVINNNPFMNNNVNGINNNNSSQLSEEQIKRNNDLYMSTFISRNPNNNNHININNNSNDNEDLRSPYNQQYNNRINNNINNNSNNNINNNNNNFRNNNYVQNPYLNGNNGNNNINIQNPYLMNNNNNNNNNNNIQFNPQFNPNNSYPNQVNLNQNNNIPINNPNYVINPYLQNEKNKNNNENKSYSINGNSFVIIDDSNINLQNKQDQSLLDRLNSDDLIPSANIKNPYI